MGSEMCIRDRIEKAARHVEAEARLSQIKAELGITSAPEPEAISEAPPEAEA